LDEDKTKSTQTCVILVIVVLVIVDEEALWCHQHHRKSLFSTVGVQGGCVVVNATMENNVSITANKEGCVGDGNDNDATTNKKTKC